MRGTCRTLHVLCQMELDRCALKHEHLIFNIQHGNIKITPTRDYCGKGSMTCPSAIQINPSVSFFNMSTTPASPMPWDNSMPAWGMRRVVKANASLYLLLNCYQNNRKTQKKHIWCAGAAIQAVQMEEVGRLAKEPQLDSSTCADGVPAILSASYSHDHKLFENMVERDCSQIRHFLSWILSWII